MQTSIFFFKKIISGISLFVLFLHLSCCSPRQVIFTGQELAIINDSTRQILKVYTIDDPADTILLRGKSTDLTNDEILSPAYKTLAEKLVRTVTDSTVDGVGIAAPQIGITRRVIAVQRFDKQGDPFEVFPNIYIKEFSAEKEIGPEACLSVPDLTGEVERSVWIIISYTHPESLQIRQDTIKGFTARIFQHEADHLDGILYTDKCIPAAGL